MTTRHRPSRATRRPSLVRLLSPMRDFLATESAGAVLLATGALLALVWANSPWSASYTSLWSSNASVRIAGHTITLDLRHWVNDALMTVFFLVVGLEIKREITTGHLATRRAALLPIAAALGGMLTPALIYLAIAGRSAPHGWAIPMATDIALAVGILAVAGGRFPPSLRAFLLALAIVDDIGAIVIIAAFYSADFDATWLVGAAAAVAATVLLRRCGVHAILAYVVLGIALWISLHAAGIHPTIAGVAMGLLAPSTPRHEQTVSVVDHLEHAIHPWSAYLIVPIFAVANSGIELSAQGLKAAFSSAITWGIIGGLVIGKPLGILITSAAAVRSGAADAPGGTNRVQMLGIGSAAGIGYTVALFITELAFTDEVRRADAKIGILVASVLSALIAYPLLSAGGPRSRPSVAVSAVTDDHPHGPDRQM
ncbi:MAG: Na(+)/H(+) antiporter NhaA [Acidimicrobiales bacterium]|nr:Na(+)/H(+) antiporter NhaA [Acidimicrobiales bacterium]